MAANRVLSEVVFGPYCHLSVTVIGGGFTLDMSGKKLVILLVFPLVLLSFIVTYRTLNPPRDHPVESVLLDKWAGAEYVSIGDDGLSEEVIIGSLSRSTEWEILSEYQKTEIAKSILLLLNAYNADNYDKYAEFRFPIATGTYAQDNTARLLSMFQSVLGSIDQLDDSDPEKKVAQDLMETYEVDQLDGADPERVFRIGWEVLGRLDIYCTDCLEGVSLSSMTIHEIEMSRSIEEVSGIHKVVLNSENVGGSMAMGPSFNFSPSMANVLESEGLVTSAYVSFYVSHGDSDHYPVHVHYYWEPLENKWLPQQIAFAYWGESVLFLF